MEVHYQIWQFSEKQYFRANINITTLRALNFRKGEKKKKEAKENGSSFAT